METEETFTVVANFLVNPSAEVNSESLVTVTAESQLDLILILMVTTTITTPR